MLFDRLALEKREDQALAPYAIKSINSKGREHPEEKDKTRTIFQRDRDRVIHSKAFRRLKGKTQVFIARFGDHYRSRLTHTMEVAQLSRDMARTLNLNEDLAETIALSHDLGHTPFGHSGQDAMNEMMKTYGDRFEHNEQSRRVIEALEEKSSEYKGLNLSYEVRDGLIKHRTFYDHPLAKSPLKASLEAQVVNIADEMAYLHHDIDDAIRSKILKVQDFESLDIWKIANKNLPTKKEDPLYFSAMKSAIVKLMVHDLAKETDENLRKYNITSVEEIYNAPTDIAQFSKGFYRTCFELKNFLYKQFYHSEEVKKYNEKGQVIIENLFKKLMNNFEYVPEDYREQFSDEERHVIVKDYIAGMTDHFAIELYEKLK